MKINVAADHELCHVEVLPVPRGEVKLDDRLRVQHSLRLPTDPPLGRGHQVRGAQEGTRLVEARGVRLRPRPLLVLLPEKVRDLGCDSAMS